MNRIGLRISLNMQCEREAREEFLFVIFCFCLSLLFFSCQSGRQVTFDQTNEVLVSEYWNIRGATPHLPKLNVWQCTSDACGPQKRSLWRCPPPHAPCTKVQVRVVFIYHIQIKTKNNKLQCNKIMRYINRIRLAIHGYTYAKYLA